MKDIEKINQSRKSISKINLENQSRKSISKINLENQSRKSISKINLENQSRSYRMKTLSKNGSNVSFGTNTISIENNSYDLVEQMQALENLLNIYNQSVKWQFMPGIKPAQSGGKWKYLSSKNSDQPYLITDSYDNDNLENFIYTHIFYTDDGKNFAAMSGQYFREDFLATFKIDYDDWYDEYGLFFNRKN